MRALIIDGPRSARVGEVEVPRPAEGQVVVDVHRVGICGTDAELYTGQLAYFEQGKSRFPLRPGHEWCGVVSAVGAGVDEAWLGARVTGDTMLGCGRCRRCRAGNGHVCADRHEIGITAWPGALADKVLVPATSLHRLPAAVDDRAGALIEPGGNAQRAAAAAQAGPGRRVLVCGPGTIGLLAAAFASAAGADVDVLAADPSRRELAAAFGASRYWTAEDPPPGTYDAVIDCTGDHRVPASALTLVEPTGRVVYIGVSPGRARSTAGTSCSTTSPWSESSGRQRASRPPSSTTPTAGSGREPSRRSWWASTGPPPRSKAGSIRGRASRFTSTRACERRRHRRNYRARGCIWLYRRPSYDITGAGLRALRENTM